MERPGDIGNPFDSGRLSLRNFLRLGFWRVQGLTVQSFPATSAAKQRDIPPKGMRRSSDLTFITTFALLTFLLTAVVLFAWEKVLLPPFYSWVDTRYPGEASAHTRWNIQQRVEYFFISITVDVVVVTLLVGMSQGQQRKLAQS